MPPRRVSSRAPVAEGTASAMTMGKVDDTAGSPSGRGDAAGGTSATGSVIGYLTLSVPGGDTSKSRCSRAAAIWRAWGPLWLNTRQRKKHLGLRDGCRGLGCMRKDYSPRLRHSGTREAMDFPGEKAAVNIVSFTVFKGNLLSLPHFGTNR